VGHILKKRGKEDVYQSCDILPTVLRLIATGSCGTNKRRRAQSFPEAFSGRFAFLKCENLQHDGIHRIVQRAQCKNIESGRRPHKHLAAMSSEFEPVE